MLLIPVGMNSALWALHLSNCRGFDPPSSWWLYWAISHPKFVSPESAPFRRKQQSNRSINSSKSELKLSRFLSGYSLKFVDCREVLGHLWQLLVGLLQQSEHISFCSSMYLPVWELPGAPVLGITSLFYLQVHHSFIFCYGSDSSKHFCQNETFSCIYLLKVKVSKKACKNTIMDVGTWVHFHKGFRKTFISRCWVTAVCFVWKFLRNAGRKYLDQVWFSGGLFVFFKGYGLYLSIHKVCSWSDTFSTTFEILTTEGEKLQLAL